MSNEKQLSPKTLTAAELAEIKEKFNQLSATNFEGILIHKKVRILNADDDLLAMLAYTPTEITEKTLLELSSPEGREIVLKNTLLEHREPYQIIACTKNGELFPAEIFSQDIAYQGLTLKVMGFRRVEQQEAAVLESLQQAKQALENSRLKGGTTLLRLSNEQLKLELDERAQMEADLRDRARQQAAVAELGQRALVGTKTSVLMDEAVALVAQVLNVEYAKIQELQPDGRTLLLCAGVGWRQGLVGQAAVSADSDSQAGYTLLSSGPVIVENMAEETRFKPSNLLQGHKVVSGMSVIIYGGKNAFGVLGAHTIRPRIFSEDDMHFLQAVANVLATALENTRLHAETQRRAEQLAVLHELDQAITTSLYLSDIYHTFAHHALRILTYDTLFITIVEDEKMRVVYATDQEQLPTGTLLPMHESTAGQVVAYGRPLLRNNILTDPAFTEDELLISLGIRSNMIIPLRVKGEVIGTWNVGQKEINAYTHEEAKFAQSMADQLAIAIENARLYEKATQEIAERQRAEAELEEERALLAQRVAERTRDLQDANEELARAARLKDEFLASMSHELRTPLTAILGMTEVLKMEAYGPLTEKQSKSLTTIDESGRHLLDLINDILDLSKIEADKLELNIEIVSVENACQNSLQFIKQTAHKKDIKVSFQHDPAVSMLEVDERRFKQILVNLLSNAVKFTPEGGQVGLEIVGDIGQQLAHFTVWDTGIGIAPEEQKQLFEPFIQLDSKLSRQYSGTGLGLALVSRMTHKHGGEVSVESEVGQGSRFTVSLPWSKSSANAGHDQNIDSKNQEPVPASTPLTEKQSILILLAEDERPTSDLIKDYLAHHGYQIMVAENGHKALEMAHEHRPNLILMDVQMPEMDGLEAIRHLRADNEIANIPVIVLTALAMQGDRERCLEAGADYYLSKPIDMRQLEQIIETQLTQGETHERGQ